MPPIVAFKEGPEESEGVELVVGALVEHLFEALEQELLVELLLHLLRVRYRRQVDLRQEVLALLAETLVGTSQSDAPQVFYPQQVGHLGLHIDLASGKGEEAFLVVGNDEQLLEALEARQTQVAWRVSLRRAEQQFERCHQDVLRVQERLLLPLSADLFRQERVEHVF